MHQMHRTRCIVRVLQPKPRGGYAKLQLSDLQCKWSYEKARALTLFVCTRYTFDDTKFTIVVVAISGFLRR